MKKRNVNSAEQRQVLKLKDKTYMIKDSVRKLYEAQLEKKRFEEHYNTVRKKEQVAISNYVFTQLPKGETSFIVELDEGMSFYTNHTTVRATVVRRKTIDWLVGKLKKKLPKSVLKQVIIKDYTVKDMQGLIDYMKELGADAKRFKKYIEVAEKFDTAKLDELYEKGELNREDIKDCYDVNVSEPYVRLTKVD